MHSSPHLNPAFKLGNSMHKCRVIIFFPDFQSLTARLYIKTKRVRKENTEKFSFSPDETLLCSYSSDLQTTKFRLVNTEL